MVWTFILSLEVQGASVPQSRDKEARNGCHRNSERTGTYILQEATIDDTMMSRRIQESLLS
ncbi:hypothetical protein FRC15_008753, partial [Serendipita sp. 397]